jgi:hypothetical protein
LHGDSIKGVWGLLVVVMSRDCIVPLTKFIFSPQIEFKHFLSRITKKRSGWLTEHKK